jgi:transcriptional regulator with XRE-family HTH domain
MHIGGMNLAEYMKHAKLTDAKLAEMVNRDRSNVTRWRLKKTRPDIDALARLEDVTGGAVSAKDFPREEAQV